GRGRKGRGRRHGRWHHRNRRAWHHREQPLVQGAKDGANISVRDALGWKEEIRHGPQAARAAGRSDRARGYDTEGDNGLTHVHAVNVKLLPDSKRHVLVDARDAHALATYLHCSTTISLVCTAQC